jgi:hypothetical protein
MDTNILDTQFMLVPVMVKKKEGNNFITFQKNEHLQNNLVQEQITMDKRKKLLKFIGVSITIDHRFVKKLYFLMRNLLLDRN